jgi:hypothetical protein
MYKAIIAIGIVVAACLVAGCGSSDDGTATAAVTKAEFVEQAEAICNKAQEEGGKSRIAWEKTNGEELGFERSIKFILGPALKQEAEELQALKVPAEDKAKVAKMIDNLSKGANSFTAEGSKAKATSNFETFQSEAKAYGLEACGL